DHHRECLLSAGAGPAGLSGHYAARPDRRRGRGHAARRDRHPGQSSGRSVLCLGRSAAEVALMTAERQTELPPEGLAWLAANALRNRSFLIGFVMTVLIVS